MEFALLRGEICSVDDSDWRLVSSYSWRAAYSYKNGRRGRVSGVVARSGRKLVLLHRILLNPSTHEEVDHKDGNPLNNCRNNLRLASRAQNSRNRGRARSNRVGFKGVYLDPRRILHPYRAEIRADGRKIKLGSFATPERAHEAYKAAAIRLHAEFHRF